MYNDWVTEKCTVCMYLLVHAVLVIFVCNRNSLIIKIKNCGDLEVRCDLRQTACSVLN